MLWLRGWLRLFSRLAQSSVALGCDAHDCMHRRPGPNRRWQVEIPPLAAVYGSPRLTIRGEEIMNDIMDMGCNS
jgi:hypothetical protein